MTDRELLPLAAKAHGGLEYVPDVDGWIQVNPDGSRGAWWNPLTDDGDALRLVVKLKLHIGMESDTVSAWHTDDFGNFHSEVLRHHGDEPATRRAIVKAAAYIGKAMP